MTAWAPDHRHLAIVGISASAMVADARQIAAVYPPGTFELPGHGFEGAASLTGAPERVRFSGNQVYGVQLDSAIDPTGYYNVSVAPDDPDFFAASSAAGPLVLAGDGVGFPFVIWNVRSTIDLIVRWWASQIVSAAKAYQGPWDDAHVPKWASLLLGQLAAPSVCKILRVASARFPVADVQADFDRGMERFRLLEAGVPFDDSGVVFDATATPDNSAMADADSAPVPWRNGGAL